MTASEFAFLALGLVLGIASGAAIVVVLGSRSPAREVRLTVERGAVPRRAATLSSDAFVTAANEPARGGPADRRRMDRDAPPEDLPPLAPEPGPGVPVMVRPAPVGPGGGPRLAPGDRTIVPSGPSLRANMGPARFGAGPVAAIPAAPVAAIPTAADRDPAIDSLRIQAVLAAQRMLAAGVSVATATTAVLEPQPAPEPPDDQQGDPASRAAEAPAAGLATTTRPGTGSDRAPVIIRILRGDHRALFDAVEIVAGADDAMRRPWQLAITALAEGIMARAIDRGILDFPVGNPFWDTFTTEQCRAIAGALAAAGHRFDAIDGWEDGRVPNYRDLTAAVAAAGMEPRRIRAWPTQDEIGELYREVTVAADELFIAAAGDLEAEALRELVGARAAELGLLWQHWDLARSVLAAPLAAD
ncbi:MAG: hypothetical protein HYX57_01165 [Chloroflexi bacterium]|nr:hypothetical protein [Chloroflexota bacterium]